MSRSIIIVGLSRFEFPDCNMVILCQECNSEEEEPSLKGDGFSLNFSKTTISTRMLAEEAPLIKEVFEKILFV